jgi:hypothetical protein
VHLSLGLFGGAGKLARLRQTYDHTAYYKTQQVVDNLHLKRIDLVVIDLLFLRQERRYPVRE